MTSSSPPLAMIVLAAGKGTRMHSSLAKVLHPLAGRAAAHPRPRCRYVVSATAAGGGRGPSGRDGTSGLRALWRHLCVARTPTRHRACRGAGRADPG